jgi:RNA polymerase sigma-54 factor
MGYSIYQKIKLKNMLFLNNKMLLSLSLLNKNLEDLEEETAKIAEANPFLEMEFLTLPREYKGSRKKNSSIEDYDEDNFEVQTRSLKSYLLDQFYTMEVTDEDEKIFLYLVESIDDHGFLKKESSDISNEIKVPEEKVEKVLALLKSMDPPGIGSKDVKESLKAQTDDKKVMMLIDLLEDVQKNPIEVRKILGISQDEFEATLSKLKHLNPYPSNGFYESPYTQYVEPDLFIIQKDDEYEIVINERFELRFSSLELYEKLMDSENKAYREFAKERYEQAKNLLEAFAKRRETLFKLGQLIVTKEKEFLNGGKVVPLKVADVSSELNLSPSTVTRAISTKYIKTPTGIHPLKFFFERFIYKSNDGDLSREEIKKKIAVIISNEDRKKPLTDSKIENILKKDGLKVSRRVIVKYREELFIPSSSKRRVK